MFKKAIEKMYRAQMFVRCDDAGNVYYFSAEDFPGLLKTPFEFRTAAGNRLQGYFYGYEGYETHRIVVFDHGMGGGHRSYLREIETLARHGYLVFSYDHTGCMESEGESTGGFATSLADLDACLSALKAHPEYGNRRLSVVGHSWGAFSAMNIAALHPDVCHQVAISGFVSVETIVSQFFGGVLKPFRRHVMAIERQSNPRFVDFDARKSLANVEHPVLLIYSRDDKTVNYNRHAGALQQALAGKKNITFLTVDGKDHNPNYTAPAVALKNRMVATLTKKLKKHELDSSEQKKAFVSSWDWRAMTEQDPNVWSVIFSCLDS